MTQERPSPGKNMIGSVLLGRYRIVRELAKGGMGIVYLARAEGAVGFVKPVVVKLILPEHAGNDRFLGMFVREAQILSQLRHPSVVDVLEFGEQDGAYVMVLEYVRGHHLGQWAKYLNAKNRRVPAAILIQLILDVLDALHQTHVMTHPDGSCMQIVHRDISPSNILLDEDGHARLLDFGVAHMRGGNVEYQTTIKGFVGKLPYTAPEIFVGGDATPKSDLYACAVVLHEILLGRNVFRANTETAIVKKVLEHVPESIANERDDLRPGFDDVLSKALAKSPHERYANAAEFASALRKLQTEPESDVRARLAALLKGDFGQELADMLGIESLADRDEAWRRLSVHPPRRDHPPGEVGETTDSQTRALQPQPPSTAPPPLPALTPESSASAVVAPPKSNRGLLVALSVVGALAVASMVLSLQNRPEAGPVPAPRIRVVSQPLDVQPPAAEPEPEPTPRPAVAEPEVEPAAEPVPPTLKRRKAGAPDGHSLARAFRKQQPEIERCFGRYAINLEGQPEIQIEFALDARGELTGVKVAPAALGGTPLGQCVVRAAARTSFPAQGRPVSFMIPVTASQVAGPEGR